MTLQNYENRYPNVSVQNARQAEFSKVNLSLHHFSVHTYLSLCTTTDNCRVSSVSYNPIKSCIFAVVLTILYMLYILYILQNVLKNPIV